MPPQDSGEMTIRAALLGACLKIGNDHNRGVDGRATSSRDFALV